MPKATAWLESIVLGGGTWPSCLPPLLGSATTRLQLPPDRPSSSMRVMRPMSWSACGVLLSMRTSIERCALSSARCSVSISSGAMSFRGAVTGVATLSVCAICVALRVRPSCSASSASIGLGQTPSVPSQTLQLSLLQSLSWRAMPDSSGIAALPVRPTLPPPPDVSLLNELARDAETRAPSAPLGRHCLHGSVDLPQAVQR